MECKNIKCFNKHDGSFGSGNYCSNSCSKSRNHSLKTKQKIKEALQNSGNPDIIINCLFCNILMILKYSKRYKKFCSVSCASKHKVYLDNNFGKKLGLASAKKRVLRSKNEIYFYELCKNYFKNVTHNENIFNGWDADVIIHDLKIAILWNGRWHYEKITNTHSLLQVQNRDIIKNKEIRKYGYTPYIIKDMGRYNKNFVVQEFNNFLASIPSDS